MDQTTLLIALRTEINDLEEPYRYEDWALLDFVQSAVSDYSRYRPRHRRGSITLLPNMSEYKLPEDYQTWIKGLEDYEILDDILYLDFPPLGPLVVPFTYLGDHDIASLPNAATSLILDYCMWKMLSDVVREGSEISELKLGKGLDIKFDNFDQITELAETRRCSYLASVQKPVGGGT
ncbi:hypothetical protein [Bacillus sp. 3255]|uniref:hypothetical protein n=1 Tax=Bacillus sp. 3255 TaxID=2817904 RepID=UPI00285F04D7|nr:hypothetical protein [Bacillus sp. 3255]MDR6883027.1 hypothetical protein [Bacillus sp. 3255]